MDWNKLLSTKRLGKLDANDAPALRTEFTRDYDRIIFNSAFGVCKTRPKSFPWPRATMCAPA